MGDFRLFTDWYLLSCRRVVGVGVISVKEPRMAFLVLACSTLLRYE